MKCPYCNNEIPEGSTSCPVCGVEFQLSEEVDDSKGNSIVSAFFYVFLGVLAVVVCRESRHEYFINNIPFYTGIFSILIGFVNMLSIFREKLSNKANNVILIAYNIISILAMMVWPCVFSYLAFKNYNTTAFAFCAIMAILGFIVVIWNIYKSIEIRKK